MTYKGYLLRDLIDIKHGFAFPGDMFSDDLSFPTLVTPGNFNVGGGFLEAKPKTFSGELREEYILQPGDLIVTMTDLSKAGDSLGYSAEVPHGRTYLHNQRVGKIVNKQPELLSLRYLNWFMRTKNYRNSVMGSATGTTVRHTSPSRILDIEITLPSYLVQLAIAATLDSIDSKIRMNIDSSKTLEEVAQTIFKSWFIDFDPVKAKMAGEKPAGMDAATTALFPNTMEESELGIIPKGWTINVISDFGKVVTGKTPSTKVPEYWGEQIPFVTIPDMHGQMLVTSTARALSQEGADSQRSQNIPAGSTMVTCIATPGLVGYATKYCQTNQQINSVIPNVEQSSIWLFWHLRGLIPTLIRNSGIGTVFANLNKSDFSNIKSITPEMALRNAFSRIAEPIMELLETLNIESQYLREIRDALLPRLISGELQIPEEILAS